MKRRTFIQACLAALAVPAAVPAVQETPNWDWRVVKTPEGKHRLSAEQVDEFVELTLKRFNEQKWEELKREVEYSIWNTHIKSFTDTVSVDWKQA